MPKIPAPSGDPADPGIVFHRHDHAHCAEDALSRAETLSDQRGLRLTPVRRRTLEILLEEHRALGAYEVLDRLAAEGFGKQPPVAYRALDFLVDQGFAHRIRRLNAFTACVHSGEPHSPVFLICSGCNTVAEAPGAEVHGALVGAAQEVGFAIRRANIEAVGLCPACQADEGAASADETTPA
ncbi:helix-turn-helix domain-containing protein [Acidimangrovimonas sediminis]|uniref:transcriptional repressor n=1 Tax=Acidimangrovimonas sediminis TaxID=2056283 RepID=UPI000C7F84B8|nr:transcriptional repressor [Acidimangrovimonas sediminis]